MDESRDLTRRLIEQARARWPYMQPVGVNLRLPSLDHLDAYTNHPEVWMVGILTGSDDERQEKGRLGEKEPLVHIEGDRLCLERAEFQLESDEEGGPEELCVESSGGGLTNVSDYSCLTPHIRTVWSELTTVMDVRIVGATHTRLCNGSRADGTMRDMPIDMIGPPPYSKGKGFYCPECRAEGEGLLYEWKPRVFDHLLDVAAKAKEEEERMSLLEVE